MVKIMDKSLCELIRDSDPILEAVDGYTEKYFEITHSYDEWVDFVYKKSEEYNKCIDNYLYISKHIPVFIECFKNCDMFMTAPVSIVDHKPVEVQSRKYSNEKKVTEFVIKNKNIIPYELCKSYDFFIFRFGEINE